MMAVLIFSNLNLVSLRYYFSFVNILNETLFYIFRYSHFVMHFLCLSMSTVLIIFI